MLCIAVKYDGVTRWGTYHIGDGQVCNGSAVDDVINVQADGHELTVIREQFANIPFAFCSVQTWYGDHAKFIAANIRL